MSLVRWLTCALCVQYAYAAVVDIHTASVLNTVSDYFISTNLPTTLLIPPKWKPFDFNSTRMRTLLRGLSPSYLRFGGSPADWSMFTEADPLFVETLNGFPQYTTYSKSDVDNLVDMTRATGTRLLFELNLQLREGYNWDPINTISLFDYFTEKGYGDNIDFELGNEVNWYGFDLNNPMNLTKEQIKYAKLVGGNSLIKLSGKQIGKDYIMLRKLMNNYPAVRRSLLVGPAIQGINGWALEVLRDFINTAGIAIDAATFHNYNFHGPDAKISQYTDVNFFAELVGTLNATKGTVAKTTTPDIAMWNTETADSWGGGTHNVTDKYISGFLWLDNLGMQAKNNIKIVMRQTFYWGNYSIIGDDMLPNPDYWMMYIHKQLVGVRVLNVTAEADALLWPGSQLAEDFQKEIRVYAHCTKPSTHYQAGAVTLFAINMKNSTNETLVFKHPFSSLNVDVYMLTPGSTTDGLLSRCSWSIACWRCSNYIFILDLTPGFNRLDKDICKTRRKTFKFGDLVLLILETLRQVRLNGKVLSMVSDSQLPTLVPSTVPASKGVVLQPLTFGFMVFPEANVAACK